MTPAGVSFAPQSHARETLALLPHFIPHVGGLQTLGGRVISLSARAGALIACCADACEFGDDELSCGDRAIAAELIEAGVLVSLCEATPATRSGAIDLVLSPHIDDAALSLGGSIVLSAHRTLVVNVFSSQSYQTGLRVPAELIDQLALAEDRLAGRLLGYDSVSLGLPGAQDRHRLGLSAAMGWGLAAVAARYAQDVAHVTQRVVETLGPTIDVSGIRTIYAPAAIGGHLDHVVVALAAPAIAAALAVPLPRLVCYEDLPYAAAGLRGGVDLQNHAPHCQNIGIALQRKRAALAIFRTRLRAPQIALCIAHAERIAQNGGAAERCFMLCDDRAPAETTA